MKIALLGYGKMGKVLEEEAEKRGHTISVKINSSNEYLLTEGVLKEVDIAIEFSSPKTVVDHIYFCYDANIPVIVGTTGWLENWNLVTEDARCRNQALFFASNFSLGMNLFFQLNSVLSKMMNEFPEYEVSISETHHRDKKDSPSGTAITLADGIIENMIRKKGWNGVGQINKIGYTQPMEEQESPIEIQSIRDGSVAGIHEIVYTSDQDEIVIKHTASSRIGFAQGAIFAAEWMLGKTGVYTMKDLMIF